MLGIRLPADAELQLERHAKSIGRGKSVIAREWIIERLDRESVDAEMRRAAILLSVSDKADRAGRQNDGTAFLKALDDEDGGYDWGPAGPPA